MSRTLNRVSFNKISFQIFQQFSPKNSIISKFPQNSIPFFKLISKNNSLMKNTTQNPTGNGYVTKQTAFLHIHVFAFTYLFLPKNVSPFPLIFSYLVTFVQIIFPNIFAKNMNTLLGEKCIRLNFV